MLMISSLSGTRYVTDSSARWAAWSSSTSSWISGFEITSAGAWVSSSASALSLPNSSRSSPQLKRCPTQRGEGWDGPRGKGWAKRGEVRRAAATGTAWRNRMPAQTHRVDVVRIHAERVAVGAQRGADLPHLQLCHAHIAQQLRVERVSAEGGVGSQSANGDQGCGGAGRGRLRRMLRSHSSDQRRGLEGFGFGSHSSDMAWARW